jgi:KUP system potassium uptake protein
VTRVQGTAVFLTRYGKGAPPLLVHYVDHCLALQEHVVLLTVQIEHVPRVDDRERLAAEDLGYGFYGVRARYGFMESPDLSKVLDNCTAMGLPVSIEEATIFVGHSRIVISGESGLARWRKRLFERMNRNANPYSMHYSLPSSRVMEIGGHIEI